MKFYPNHGFNLNVKKKKLDKQPLNKETRQLITELDISIKVNVTWLLYHRLNRSLSLSQR